MAAETPPGTIYCTWKVVYLFLSMLSYFGNLCNHTWLSKELHAGSSASYDNIYTGHKFLIHLIHVLGLQLMLIACILLSRGDL